MQNFNFYNPTRIVFGQNTIAQLDDLLPKKARILVLYGGGSVLKNGTLDEVEKALGKRKYKKFGGIEPNPTYETLMKAVALVKEKKIDFLLAVGGGSVIDGTKFVAAAACYEKKNKWKIAETHGAVIKSALPFGAVLTLPAAGSEMNNGAVITNQELKAKLALRHECLYPVFSILDPTKTFTLPREQTANGVVDTFVHVAEQYLTYPVQGMVQDRFAESLLTTLIEIGPKLMEEPENYDLRANMMWTATLALNGLIGAGVPQDWTTHMIGHELTALYNIDHARTLAMVLPAVMHVERTRKKDKLVQYAERIWGISKGTQKEKIDQAIRLTGEFFEKMGMKLKLSDYGIKAEEIPNVVTQLEKHEMTALGEQGKVTLKVSQRILETCL